MLSRLRQAASSLKSRNAKNSLWNTCDLLVPPAVLLGLSPVLIAQMGSDEFGFWMLLNSFIGFIGALNFGLGDATIKYAASHQVEGGLRRREFAANLVVVFSLLGLVVGAAVVLAADWLVRSVFSVEPGFVDRAGELMTFGGIWLGAKLIESGLVALVKGSQRYDLVAKITIVENVGVIVAALVFSTLGFGLLQVLYFAIAAVLLAIAYLLRTITRLFDLREFRLFAGIGNLAELAPFSFWSWLQGIAGSVFNQVDKLLIGATIGVATLSVYVVSLQIGQLIHAVFAAATAFLFPLTSQLLASGDDTPLARLFARSMSIVIPAAAALTIFIVVIADFVLVSAFGLEFSESGTVLLRLNAIAFGGLALSVIPYYIINGAGLVRINVYFAVSSAVIITAVLPTFLEMYGVMGGSLARLLNFIVIIPYLVVVKTRIVKSLTWTTLLRQIAGFVLPVGALAVVVYRYPPDAAPATVFAAIAAAGLGWVTSWLVVGRQRFDH